MPDTTASLLRKISSAGDLQSVVRTMKTMAAAGVSQFENAAGALHEYARTIQLGQIACLRGSNPQPLGEISPYATTATKAIVLVFGTDQGLVGQFNDTLVNFVITFLATLPGEKAIWTVGERLQAGLTEAGLATATSFALPGAISAITPLVGTILNEIETHRATGYLPCVYVLHNHPDMGALYTPVSQRLLPLDEIWRQTLTTIPWPTPMQPEVLNSHAATFLAFIREYLVVSLARACTESLASENACRLAAMQRAEKNIDDLLEELQRTYHRLRQSSIDEELFDVISGFEALEKS